MRDEIGDQLGGVVLQNAVPSGEAATPPPAPIRTKRKPRSSGEATTQPLSPMSPVSLAATIDALIALQRQRAFCIKSQSRCDRSCEAFIATNALQYRNDLDAKERKKIFKKAAAIRRAVESGGDPSVIETRDQRANVAAVSPIILLSAQGRAAADTHRKTVEKQMCRLAKSLPVYPWAKAVQGLGDLGIAIIVAETGDLANYRNPAKVWKRLGLAVINGERQQKKTDVEKAAAHGYSPRRRAEIWALADSMFKHQWRGDKDEDGKDPTKTKKPVAVPAHAIGPYGEHYGRKKAEYLAREGWTPKHADNAARRYMTKSLLVDLWAAWRAANTRLETNPIVPPAELSEAA